MTSTASEQLEERSWWRSIYDVNFEPMPTYKNRPPLPEQTPVWRYLNLSGVIATVKTRKLRLTRLDTFRDRFEGSVPKKQMEVQDVLFMGAGSRRQMMNSVSRHYPGMARTPPPDEDSWARITRLRRAQTRSAHASCWSHGEESEALWRLYCGDDSCPGFGVAQCGAARPRCTEARACKTRGRGDAGASAASTITSRVSLALSRRKQGFESPRERQ